jgi:drug/metabolite transporter (DMT)-like permease
MRRIGVGAFFGPFLGVSLSLLAIQRTQAGVAATIIAITPVLIIPPAVLLFKERVTLREVVGAVIAVCGVAVMFLV